MRILCGLSTLLLLPTGSAQSLCYQLAAFLYHRRSRCISIVVSPLISLMDEQVSGLPSALTGVCIHSNLTPSQREAAIRKVRSGQAQLLLLSPESITASGFFSRLCRHFPPVPFACLDEADCVSRRAHNFRPAYLCVCKAVLRMLRRWSSEEFGNSGNSGNCGNCGNCVLVVCTRREDSERLAQLIQSEFPEVPGMETQKGQREAMQVCAVYHAGLSAERRRRTLRAFMAGRVWALCGTACIGLGMDRAPLRAVLQHGGPACTEAFLQHVGRAGRDGKPAWGHLILHKGIRE